MKKVTVTICLGTTCFVMGGAELSELPDILEKKFGGKVEVKGAPCLDFCSASSEFSKAPYVKVGNGIIQQATVKKVAEAVELILAAE